MPKKSFQVILEELDEARHQVHQSRLDLIEHGTNPDAIHATDSLNLAYNAIEDAISELKGAAP